MKKLIPLFLFAAVLLAEVTDYKIVSFEWDSHLEHERVTKYRLYYKEVSTEEYSDYVEVLGDNIDASVLGLHPNTSYTAVVTAINTVDDVDLESDPSNEVEFTTTQFYETPSAPRNFKIKNFVQININ